MWIIASIIITHMWHLYMQKLSHDEWRRFYGWILLDFYLQKTNALHFLIDFFFYFFYIYFSSVNWAWAVEFEKKIKFTTLKKWASEMKMKKEVEIMNATAPLVQITVHCHPSVEFIKNTSNTLDLAFRNPST